MKVDEVEVKEMADEKDKVSFGGPLALVSKTNVNEAYSDIEDKEDEEGLIVNYDDEAMSYYSNNNVKNFYKNL